jgi:ubiquitin-conjugating enzyme E2 variant
VILATLVGEAVLGWLAADFLSGAFHWWEDRYGRTSWPLVGPWIIAPNRLHHVKPLAFLEKTFWGRNNASIIASSLVGAVLAATFGMSLWLAVMGLGGALANEVHRYTHQPSQAPAWVRLLQEIGLLQSPKSHALHHRPPQDRNYCVLSDWLNPVLEKVRLWDRLEGIFGKPIG